MGCPIRCVYVRKGVMPVLRIVVDGWMGGCNACVKDCYGWMDVWVGAMHVLRIANWLKNSQQQQRKMYHQILYKGKKKNLVGQFCAQ